MGRRIKIVNGITDWVYEEEFSFVRAFDWNTDSNQIAFIRFDETDVPEFSMDVFGSDLYQTQQVFKYPKAGETNSKASSCSVPYISYHRISNSLQELLLLPF